MRYWNTLAPITLVHQRLFGTLPNFACMRNILPSIVCLSTFQISRPSISMTMMTLMKLWTVMPSKRLLSQSGSLPISLFQVQRSVLILTFPITLFGTKRPGSGRPAVVMMSLEGCMFTHLQGSAFISGCS